MEFPDSLTAGRLRKRERDSESYIKKTNEKRT